MRHVFLFAAALAATASSAAMAEDAVGTTASAQAFVAKRGQVVVSADGKKVGRIDKLAGDRAGLIVNSTYVYVPVASLSAGENGRAVSTLTMAEITKR